LIHLTPNEEAGHIYAIHAGFPTQVANNRLIFILAITKKVHN